MRAILDSSDGEGFSPSNVARAVRRIGCLCLAALVLGCAVKRSSYDVPDVPLPEQYKNLPALTAPDAATAESKEAVSAGPEASPDTEMVHWWRSFGNRELAELIDRGLANNPDMRIAIQRMAQAKARADQAKAGQLPTISAPVMAGKGSVPVGAGVSESQQSIQASIRSDWRLDIWGEQSALAESAKLQLWRAAFERDNVQRNMAANLASAYVEYLSFNDRLRVARETEKVLSSMLSTIAKRVEAGDATMSELQQHRAAIYAVRASIPGLEQQREDAINAIAFLVGTVPGSLKLSDDGLDTLSRPNVVPGLPSALLLRRPDVRMVEARLLAADADIDVARARILPPVDLAAQAGYSSTYLAQFFQPKALFWNVLVNLSVSIFDGGRRASEKEFSQAVHEEMVENYVRTIFQAMREVEGSLATIRLAGRRLEAQQEATSAARRAWDISTDIYAVGGVDYLTLLDTERTYHRYLDDYQRIRVDYYRGYISLFQALGGGVKLANALPGKGEQQLQPVGVKFAPGVPEEAPAKALSVEGVAWEGGGIESFWQVELAGLYHRNIIGAVWRDLRVRYPQFMENRILRPRLNGRIEDSADGQEAWYRLYVAKFHTVALAEAFCSALQASQQRCRVVSSTLDDSAPVTPKPDTPMKESGSSNVPLSGPMERDVSDLMAYTLPPVMLEHPEVIKPAAADLLSKAMAGRNDPKDKRAYAVQLGAFASLENAIVSSDFWHARGYETYVSEIKDAESRTWYAVRSGAFAQRRKASDLALAMGQMEDVPAIVVMTRVDKAGNPARVDVARLPRPAEPLAAPDASPPPAAGAGGSSKAAVQRETPQPRPVYAVQLEAFSSLDNAAKSLASWRAKGYDSYVCEVADAAGQVRFAVRTGRFAQRREASALVRALGQKEDARVMLVPALLDRDGQLATVDISHLLEGRN